MSEAYPTTPFLYAIPGLVVEPATAGDVVLVVDFAKEHGIPIAVVGGNRGYQGQGISPGGIVISLARMRDVKIVRDKKDKNSFNVEAGGVFFFFLIFEKPILVNY